MTRILLAKININFQNPSNIFAKKMSRKNRAYLAFGRKNLKITLQSQRNIVILSVKLAKLQFYL
jgi:hypothetical protein